MVSSVSARLGTVALGLGLCACATTPPAVATSAADDSVTSPCGGPADHAAGPDTMPDRLAKVFAQGLKVCTGELSGRRAMGREVAKVCVVDGEQGAQMWLEEMIPGEGAEMELVETRLPGIPERKVDAEGGVHYALNIDLASTPPHDVVLGHLAERYDQVQYDLRLSQRYCIRTEGALSQHFVGRLSRSDTPHGSQEILPSKVIDGLHFYSIEHDPHLHWGYRGDTGPDNWGLLEADDEACVVDRPDERQSPIFLTTSDTNVCSDSEGLTKVHYRNSRVSLVNNGHTVMASVVAPEEEVDPEQSSYIEADGKRYRLLQFHVHAPSEHMIDDPLAGPSKVYPMEIHLVHQADDGQLAVVAVFVEIAGQCAASELMSSLLNKFPAGLNEPRELPETIEPESLLPPPQRRAVYAYEGSLTTPPCTEGVQWYVMQSPVSMTPEQLKMIEGLIGGPNARRQTHFDPPLPPINGRRIRLCSGPVSG